MRYLIDTNIFIFYATDADRLTRDVLAILDDLFEDIGLERRLELAFEWVRYQDLIRWGDAASVLADQGKTTCLGTLDSDGNLQYMTTSDAGFKSYNVLLPFPETEITVNPYITQNTGY